MQDPVLRVHKFMLLGGQYCPLNTPDVVLPQELLRFLDRVDEESNETFEAIVGEDVPEILDGFLDIAYAAFTGAIRAAGYYAASEAWEAICQANENKVNGLFGPVTRHPETGKIQKPEGWKDPDIEGIVARYSGKGEE